MKITESQLRRIIRQEVTRLNEAVGALTPGPIHTAEQFRQLNPGDRITVEGKPASVETYEATIATLLYTLEGSSSRRELDARYAWADDDDEIPEIRVVWVGPGAPVKARLAPRPQRFPRWLD